MVMYFQAPWVVELTESPEEPLTYDEPRPCPGPRLTRWRREYRALVGLQHQQATEPDRAEPVAVTSNQIAVPPAPMGWASWNTFDR
jgi:hypothetical protein